MQTLIALLGLLASAPAVEQPYSFQDSVLGTEFSSWSATHPDATCRDGELPGDKVCAVPTPDFIKNYGSVRYSFYQQSTEQPARLWEINLNAAAINEETVLNGLVGKWGKPHKLGLYADTWARGGSTISFMRLSNGVAFSIVLDAIKAARDKLKKDQASSNF